PQGQVGAALTSLADVIEDQLPQRSLVVPGNRNEVGRQELLPLLREPDGRFVKFRGSRWRRFILLTPRLDIAEFYNCVWVEESVTAHPSLQVQIVTRT